MIKKVLSPITLLLVLLVVALVAGKQLISENVALKGELNTLKSDPAILAKEEVKTLVAKLSSLVDLPEGEPVVATVTDKEKLKDQPLFAKAENGDKLVIYAEAGKAFLYDPVGNKVRDIIPVNPTQEGDVAGATTATGSAEQK